MIKFWIFFYYTKKIINGQFRSYKNSMSKFDSFKIFTHNFGGRNGEIWNYKTAIKIA
jgi:hypothetical protein